MKKYLVLLFLFPFISIYSQNLDIDLLRDINLNRNKHLDGVFMGITNSASPLAYGVPALLLTYGFLEKDSLTKQKAIYIGTTVFKATIINVALKFTFNRTRPFDTYPFIEKVTNGGSPSFPSGHTSDAFSLATSVSLAYRKWYIVVPSFVWASAVGYSRLAFGVHYPSDVLMGAIVGSGTAFLFYKCQKWIHKK